MTAEPRVYRPRGRLIILESPSPMDLLQDRSESHTLGPACRLIGFETTSLLIRSKKEFADSCRYIATIDKEHDSSSSVNVPLFIHIACHGNSSELGFGADSAKWADVAKALTPLWNLRNYDGPCVLSLSACGADRAKITTALSESIDEDQTPPMYVFVTNEENVCWDDAMLAWVTLYHRIGNDKK